MDILKDHPAIKLGEWLKASRQKKGFVKRVFAEQISLTPAQYTELEAGVMRWLGSTQRELIVTTLNLAHDELKRFEEMLKAAQAKFALSFASVFSREELEPVRFRFNDKNCRADAFDKETILNAVFADAS